MSGPGPRLLRRSVGRGGASAAASPCIATDGSTSPNSHAAGGVWPCREVSISATARAGVSFGVSRLFGVEEEGGGP